MLSIGLPSWLKQKPLVKRTWLTDHELKTRDLVARIATDLLIEYGWVAGAAVGAAITIVEEADRQCLYHVNRNEGRPTE